MMNVLAMGELGVGVGVLGVLSVVGAPTLARSGAQFFLKPSARRQVLRSGNG